MYPIFRVLYNGEYLTFCPFIEFITIKSHRNISPCVTWFWEYFRKRQSLYFIIATHELVVLGLIFEWDKSIPNHVWLPTPVRAITTVTQCWRDLKRTDDNDLINSSNKLQWINNNPRSGSSWLVWPDVPIFEQVSLVNYCDLVGTVKRTEFYSVSRFRPNLK